MLLWNGDLKYQLGNWLHGILRIIPGETKSLHRRTFLPEQQISLFPKLKLMTQPPVVNLSWKSFLRHFLFFICHPVAKKSCADTRTLSIHFPSPATYKIRNSHVLQLQQRRSIITTGPIILQAVQSQLAALHHSSIAITSPIVFLLPPRVQTMVAAPKCCVGGCVFNSCAKRAGIHHSKWISEDGETGADY